MDQSQDQLIRHRLLYLMLANARNDKKPAQSWLRCEHVRRNLGVWLSDRHLTSAVHNQCARLQMQHLVHERSGSSEWTAVTKLHVHCVSRCNHLSFWVCWLVLGIVRPLAKIQLNCLSYRMERLKLHKHNDPTDGHGLLRIVIRYVFDLFTLHPAPPEGCLETTNPRR